MGRNSDQGAEPSAAGPEEAFAAGNAGQAEAWNGTDGEYWTKYRERQEARARHLTPHLLAAAGLRADSRVLDIGCGTGGTSLAAARTAVEGAVLGVDLSGQMLGAAREQAAAAGLAQVTFAQADAQVHRFEPGAFDTAISRFGVMFFADPEAAFANIAGALRPGGRLAFLCWRSLAENAYLTVPFAAVGPYVQPPSLGGPGEPGPFSLEDPDRIRTLLDGAGFDAITVDAVDEPLWLGSDLDGVMASLLEMPLIRTMLEEAGEGARAEATTALRDAMAAHQGQDGVTLGSAAWLVTARRR